MEPRATAEVARGEPRGRARSRAVVGRAGALAAIALLPAMAGCASSGSAAAHFQLAPESLQYKAAQTRHFETSDSKELLSASAAVLQDLGFDLEESARELGFLRAAKEHSAREFGQQIGRVLVLILTFGKLAMPIDLHQKIAATLVAWPVNESGTRHEVRIMFYRVVWKGDGVADRQYLEPGEQCMEMVRDPVIYQTFFARLSKAVFLEAHTL
jgi:hypothetical protein